MLKNKRGNMSPFDMKRKPARQNLFLLPLIWAICRVMTARRLTLERIGMDNLLPPYLVLSQHQGFQDYYITSRALEPHRTNYISDVEGFAAFGAGLYRQIGCIAARRYAGDVSLVRNIQRVIERNGDIVVLYPEARHSNVGTSSTIPPSVGRLVKLLRVPVVIQRLYGSYLSQPVWDEHNNRRAPIRSVLEKVLEPEDIKAMTADDITKRLNELFHYDEYQWQLEQKIHIDYPKRAEGLHSALFLCPHCGAERMSSRDATLRCDACGKAWRMDELGRLRAVAGITEFSHIPDWYEHQRAEVTRMVDIGAYRLDVDVTIEALPNSKGFVKLGKGRLVHHAGGFELTLNGETLGFSSASMHSVHIEYDYRRRGDCIVLSTRDCCYYLYQNEVNVTKIMLAGERFHEKALGMVEV